MTMLGPNNMQSENSVNFRIRSLRLFLKIEVVRLCFRCIERLLSAERATALRCAAPCACCAVSAVTVLALKSAGGADALARKNCDPSVWVIRHGEKSANPQPGSPEVLGLNATGVALAIGACLATPAFLQYFAEEAPLIWSREPWWPKPGGCATWPWCAGNHTS